MKKTLFLLIAALFAVNVSVMAQTPVYPITVELYDNGGGGWEDNILSITYITTNGVEQTDEIFVAWYEGDYHSDVLYVEDGSDMVMWLSQGTGSTIDIDRYFTLKYDNGKVFYGSPLLTDTYHATVNMLYANKDKTSVTVTLNSSIDGAGFLTGDGDYQVIPSEVTVTATPHDGYLFENWTRDGVVCATTSSYTFEAQYDCSIMAVFTKVEAGKYIGNINSEEESYYLPGYSYNNYSISQQIYTANELNAGNITSISFYNGGLTETRHYKIYLSATGKTSYNSDAEGNSNDWIPVNNDQLVYDGDVDLVKGYWTKINITQYSLSEGDGLCVTVFDNSGSDYEEEHIKCRVYNADGNQSLYVASDATLNPLVLGYSGKVLPKKNQIILGYTSFTVNASVYPVAGGTVSGTGSYIAGETCTLTATPSSGYRFLGWMENDVIITHDNPYTFTVDGNRDLVAKFFTKHWNREVSGTNSGMNMAGKIIIDGVIQGDEQHVKYLELGAFCEGQCRESQLAGNNNKFAMYVLGNNGEPNPDNGKMINFKVYDHLTEQELNLASGCDKSFVPDYWNLSYNYTFFNEFTISATINPEGAGEVTGTGNYQYGTSATLTATANLGYAFKCWKIGEDVVSTNISYTINPVVANVTVEACFNYEYTTPLAQNWNWWSTPIEVNDIDGLTMLENSLGNLGVIIKSQNAWAYQDGGDWDGNLSSIVNEESYLIQMSAAGNSVITGDFANPASHHITLQPAGWTWVGYPVSVEQDVISAMGVFVPYEEDIIKNQGRFAYYTSEDGWIEQDGFAMTPGVGYMYHTNSTTPNDIVYSNGSKNGITTDVKEYYWSNNPHAFADNMCIIATVYVEDVEQNNNNLEVGAFVNGECRGRAHLKYIASRDRYYALLTVAGQDGDMVEFGLVDVESNRISSESKTEVAFSSNAIIGGVKQPFEIKVGAMEAISRNKLNIFPNPVDRNTSVILNVPVDETIKEIVVTNTLGAVVDRKITSLNIIENGMLVSGMYMVKVVCNSGNVYIGKLIVR